MFFTHSNPNIYPRFHILVPPWETNKQPTHSRNLLPKFPLPKIIKKAGILHYHPGQSPFSSTKLWYWDHNGTILRNKRERRYPSTTPDSTRNKTRQPRKTTTSLACKTHPTPGLGNCIIGIILRAELHVYLTLVTATTARCMIPRLTQRHHQTFTSSSLSIFQKEKDFYPFILTAFLSKSFTTLAHG